jgi:hypothetical protein
MAKIYIQEMPVVWETTASVAAGGSANGSAFCSGYTAIRGGMISSGSLEATDGLQICQSWGGSTLNWDYWENFTLSASSGSVFSASLFGDAVKVRVTIGADDADELRAGFWLHPI